MGYILAAVCIRTDDLDGVDLAYGDRAPREQLHPTSSGYLALLRRDHPDTALAIDDDDAQVRHLMATEMAERLLPRDPADPFGLRALLGGA